MCFSIRYLDIVKSDFMRSHKSINMLIKCFTTYISFLAIDLL